LVFVTELILTALVFRTEIILTVLIFPTERILTVLVFRTESILTVLVFCTGIDLTVLVFRTELVPLAERLRQGGAKERSLRGEPWHLRGRQWRRFDFIFYGLFSMDFI
jgi:hypothetical protein